MSGIKMVAIAGYVDRNQSFKPIFTKIGEGAESGDYQNFRVKYKKNLTLLKVEPNFIKFKNGRFSRKEFAEDAIISCHWRYWEVDKKGIYHDKKFQSQVIVKGKPTELICKDGFVSREKNYVPEFTVKFTGGSSFSGSKKEIYKRFRLSIQLDSLSDPDKLIYDARSDGEFSRKAYAKDGRCDVNFIIKGKKKKNEPDIPGKCSVKVLGAPDSLSCEGATIKRKTEFIPEFKLSFTDGTSIKGTKRHISRMTMYYLQFVDITKKRHRKNVVYLDRGEGYFVRSFMARDVNIEARFRLMAKKKAFYQLIDAICPLEVTGELEDAYLPRDIKRIYLIPGVREFEMPNFVFAFTDGSGGVYKLSNSKKETGYSIVLGSSKPEKAVKIRRDTVIVSKKIRSGTEIYLTFNVIDDKGRNIVLGIGFTIIV